MFIRRSQWPRGLRRRSAAVRLLRSWVRIPPGAWMFVCCDCCVLSGRGVYDELITRPEESYRRWWVFVCDLETSRMRRPWHALGRSATEKICLFIFVSLKVCYSRDVVSRMWTSFLKCVAAHKRLTNVGLDHPYITHLAVPLFRLSFASYCQWRAERNSRKSGWDRWHVGRPFFNLFSLLL